VGFCERGVAVLAEGAAEGPCEVEEMGVDLGTFNTLYLLTHPLSPLVSTQFSVYLSENECMSYFKTNSLVGIG
jgi:hypothetical protein